jgi:3-oxoacyl-(acyl-carrier-protein) synthase
VRGVAITGVGIVSALGSGVAAHLEAMRGGRTPLGALTLFSPGWSRGEALGASGWRSMPPVRPWAGGHSKPLG